MTSGIRHQTMVPQQALFLMNSPLVIKLARQLAAMPDFIALNDDEARLKYLYERIYQRLPEPEEMQLGLEFINQTPLREETVAQPDNNGAGENKIKPGKRNRPAFNGNRQRAPLTSWEEYAQALLQANETTFVN